MKRILVFCFVIVNFIYCRAQTIIGKVIDSTTDLPIAYASVGILHSNIGTITDTAGIFKLDLSKAVINDTLKISFIGYSEIVKPVRAYKNGQNNREYTYTLSQLTKSLHPVIIRGGGEPVTKVIGNTVKSSFAVIGFSSNQLGTEVGSVLSYGKEVPALIKDVNFNVENNGYDSLLFKINIYDFKNNSIGASILQKPIFVECKTKQGTITVDLSDESIYINNDVLLCLEWVKEYSADSMANKSFDKLHFSASLLRGTSYARKSCQADWEKCPVGIGFWATVIYYKE